MSHQLAWKLFAGLPNWATRALHIEEIIVVAVFSFEYLLRIVAAKQKLAFIFSFRGLVDLLAIAPSFFTGFDARWVRVLRLLRLLRVLKLQTHILETTVAERTRELADKNTALEQAQAQMQSRARSRARAAECDPPGEFPRETRLRWRGANDSGDDDVRRFLRLHRAARRTDRAGDSRRLRPRRAGGILHGRSAHQPARFCCAAPRARSLPRAHQPALCEQNPLDLFVTVFYCVFDPTSGALRYANGGHNPPYLRRADGSVEALDGAGGLVLGVIPAVEFPDHTVQLRPGDRLVLYTDGLTEAFNPADEAYGTERLMAEVQAHGNRQAAAIVERICDSVTTFAGGAAQSDDITLTVLTWSGP